MTLESSYAYSSDSEIVDRPIEKSNEDAGKWETLKVDESYEIFNQFPFPIRKKGSDKPIKETFDKSSGYYRCKLNRKNNYKHRILALQFLHNPNPTKFKCVDHINHVRTDNRLENLRWVSHLQNMNNKTNQQFLQTIDKKVAIEVKNFNSWEFEDLWFVNDSFVRFNGINYSVINKVYNKRKNIYQTSITDINGKRRTIRFPRFKREFGLI